MKSSMRIATVLIAFTMLLFVVSPGALDHPLRTLIYGLGWGLVVLILIYSLMKVVGLAARRGR